MPVPPLTPLAAAALHVGRSPERVLEIDCGEGEGALFLAREFPAARVRGVDGSERQVRAASAKVGLDPEGRIAFKRGGRSSLPYPDDFFDLVALLDSGPAAAETARVLRPGGNLIVANSRRQGFPRALAARFARLRLARRGFEQVAAEDAGDGSFCVFRLRDRDRPAGTI